MPHFTTNIPIVIVNQDGSRISASLNWENIIILINDGVTVTLNGRKLDAALAQNELNKLRLLHDVTPPPPPPIIGGEVPPPSSISVKPNLSIENNRIVGRIDFLASPFIGDLSNGGEIRAIFNWPDDRGRPQTKLNALRFFPGELDERINYNEAAFGQRQIEATIALFVPPFTFQSRISSTQITIRDVMPPIPDPCPLGQHRDPVTNLCVPDEDGDDGMEKKRFQGDIFTAVIAGLIGIAAVTGFKKRFEK